MFISFYSITLSACEPSKTVIFHIDDTTVEATAKDDIFYSPDSYLKEGKRFLGWSVDNSKANIIETNYNVNKSTVDELFNDDNKLDLYAMYADIIKVDFILDTTYTYVLDSDLKNKETVPLANKDGFRFLGWSVDEPSSNTILDAEVKTIDYAHINLLNLGKCYISFYPVYKQNNIMLYEYNVREKMAEIHIETKDHIAIDDSSLINPNEHKGKNGELPVYNYVNATISIDHCEDQYVLNNVSSKVKVRGNYTSSYAKKPIRIKFDKKQKMLGLNNDNELKSWVLLANWKDTSMLRDASAFYLGNALLESDGYYCSDFRFVKVFLNDSYNGVYLLVEQQQLDSKRVNAPESKDAEDSFKTGYLLEYDGYYKNEAENQRFTISYNDIKNGNTGFTVSNDLMNDEQYNFIKKVTQNIWKVVYDACKKSHNNLSTSPYHTIDSNGDYIVDESITSSKEAVNKVIDTRSLVNMYILHEILEDRDIGFSSFYFSLDFSEKGNKKLTFNAPWDFDYAIGNSTFSNALRATISTSSFKNAGRLDTTGKKFKQDTVLKKEDFTISNKEALYCENTDNPWFIVVSKEKWLWDAIYERWQEAESANVFNSLLNMIDTYTNKYNQDFNENFTKWSESMGLKLSDYQPTIVTYFVTQKQASDFLGIWLKERIDGLSKIFKQKANT